MIHSCGWLYSGCIAVYSESIDGKHRGNISATYRSKWYGNIDGYSEIDKDVSLDILCWNADPDSH